MDTYSKIEYIQISINNKKINHNYIKNFIKINNIKCTENMNGTFVNLSILDEKIIDILYDYIYNNLNNKIEIERNNIINESIKIINNPPEKNIIKKEEKIYIKKKDLTPLELKIIELSKTI